MNDPGVIYMLTEHPSQHNWMRMIDRIQDGLSASISLRFKLYL
jgi:hypothetical protein